MQLPLLQIGIAPPQLAFEAQRTQVWLGPQTFGAAQSTFETQSKQTPASAWQTWPTGQDVPLQVE